MTAKPARNFHRNAIQVLLQQHKRMRFAEIQKAMPHSITGASLYQSLLFGARAGLWRRLERGLYEVVE